MNHPKPSGEIKAVAIATADDLRAHGLSCELAGAKSLLERLPTILGNSKVKVIAAPCVGRCEQAPVAVVHQYPVLFADVEKISNAIKNRQTTHPKAKDDAQFEPADFVQKGVSPEQKANVVSPAYVGYEAYRAKGGYALASNLANQQQDPETVIKAMEDSGLRGLGGAGFPAGRKWRIVRDQTAPKLMAVNIDEGEPGTFKDRTYLERDPHRFLEGMLIAAQVVGIDACYIYLRDEYHGCRELLANEIQKLQANPPYKLPLIELRRGAGAYICGEESAMIESIEGKRGEPRMRPPYIAQVGLFGRPTLEHNFETLYWVRDIVQRGVMVFSHHDKARDAALNVMRFFEHESCGQCTPCRVGTSKAAQLMLAPKWDQATLEDLSTVMIDASICGLGQAAPNPIRCIAKYFPEEIA